MNATQTEARAAAITMLETARIYLHHFETSKTTVEGADAESDTSALSDYGTACRTMAGAYVNSACMILDPGKTFYDVDPFIASDLPGGQAVADLSAQQYAAVVAAWIDKERAAGR